MVKLLVIAALSGLVAWGLLGSADPYVIAVIMIVSTIVGSLLGALFNSDANSNIYGIFRQEGKEGFVVAKLSPTEELSSEDRSAAILHIINSGGVPIDTIGYFLVKHGCFRLGMKFVVKPKPLSQEYIDSHSSSIIEGDPDLKKEAEKVGRNLKDKED